jgi:hypothetical protein
MSHEYETRRADDAAGFGNSSCIAADKSENILCSPHIQVREIARRQYLVERLHVLGLAPLAYFLAENADLHQALEEYAALPAELIRAYGGNQFPRSIHAIDGGKQ